MPHSAAVGNNFFDETFPQLAASFEGVKTLLFLLLAFGTLAAAHADREQTGATQAGAAGKTLEAEAVLARLTVKGNTGPKATVLVFVAHDCPVSNALTPEMTRIAEKYSLEGVAFFFVYAERDLPEAEARRHAHEFLQDARVTVDRQGALVARAGAKVTPEAAVFARSGEVIYRGRINDLFPALGKKRAEPTTHDLRDALDAILAGKAPPVANTPAIGCFIATSP